MKKKDVAKKLGHTESVLKEHGFSPKRYKDNKGESFVGWSKTKSGMRHKGQKYDMHSSDYVGETKMSRKEIQSLGNRREAAGMSRKEPKYLTNNCPTCKQPQLGSHHHEK